MTIQQTYTPPPVKSTLHCAICRKAVRNDCNKSFDRPLPVRRGRHSAHDQCHPAQHPLARNNLAGNHHNAAGSLVSASGRRDRRRREGLYQYGQSAAVHYCIAGRTTNGRMVLRCVGRPRWFELWQLCRKVCWRKYLRWEQCYQHYASLHQRLHLAAHRLIMRGGAAA